LPARSDSTAPPSASGEPNHTGYMLTRLDCLANVSSLEHERWKRAHPKFCRRMGAT